MNSIEDTLSMLELAHRCENAEREREEWRECCERMVWSAPSSFSNSVDWLKALLLAKKMVEKSVATARVNELLSNKKEWQETVGK